MAKTFVLKKVPLWPVIRMGFILFLVLGVIIGVFYALIISSFGFLAGALNETATGGELAFMRSLGFVLIPVVAIVYAIFATIVVAIWVLMYNLLASVVGGVELVLDEQIVAAPPRPVPSFEAGEGTRHEKTIDGF